MLLGILLFAATMVTVVLTIGIWPGEAKLTAPFLCPDDQPDAFVVADTYQVQPGESSTNFTLYCMGPRGDFTDAGFFRSFAILTGFHAAIIVALILLVGARRAARRRSAGQREVQEQGTDPSAHLAPDPISGIGIQADGDETELEPPGPIIS